MTAIATLTINDGAASPAAHSFVPVSTDGQTARWAEKTSGVPIGFLTISYEMREPKTATAAYRGLLGFNCPVLATISGVLTKVRNSSAQVIFNFAQDSTDQERKDLVAYVINALSNATMKSNLISVEPSY